MIQVNDLRIGNWYKQLTIGNYSQVDLFLFHEIYDDESYLDHLMPIPLTPEILEKCGFENDHGAWWTLKIPLPEGYTYPEGYFSFSYCTGVLGINMYSGGGFSIEDAAQILKDEKERGVDVKDNSFDLNIENKIFPPIRVEYLHQLQNLYFALTGHELEVKL